MTNIFHSAAIKLTAWYLLIIMALSIGASVALYHVSVSDLERDARGQVGYYNGFLGPDDINSYKNLRLNQLDQDRDHLKASLFAFNAVVLLAGGVASYALARRTLRPIEESHQAQVRFAGDASHELRTPLTAMQSEIEVALRDPNLTKTQAVEQLKSNLEEVAKLRLLADALLKLTNNNAREDMEQAVSVKDIVSLAVERSDKQAGDKKIKVTNSVKDSAVIGNQQHLVDLVAILLDNAIKYSPTGSTVAVSSALTDKKSKIIVSDKGSGIKTEDLPNIFERFYRADSSRSKNAPGGYGLGLALAKRIADLHHASIDVKSTPGKGSTFTIVLPRA